MNPDPCQPIPPRSQSDGGRRAPWLRVAVWLPTFIGIVTVAAAFGSHVRAVRIDARERGWLEVAESGRPAPTAAPVEMALLASDERQATTRPAPATSPAPASRPSFWIGGRVVRLDNPHSGDTRSIAFVCDASGSMIDKLAALKGELATAVQGLKPIDRFAVIFFRDGQSVAFEDGRQVAGAPENKRKLSKWLMDVGATGTSDPAGALAVAFRAKPNLVYLVTDGDFPDNRKVAAQIAALNRDKHARVNTIAFTSGKGEPGAEPFLKFLQDLAIENGGQFRRVALDELH